ncbi:hypothetical protein P0Y43_01845 [Pseudomonas entomophila]|uniref:hypothetical protein n=1 Tax=Pseudomonas entomophila TaxID=312306 RepID=UPI0023D7B884|nr:hypothetical protein [Pseudomonas entomophila]MDF0729469.1 hypothetical protein [Pseudomonas entomophila]
MVGITGVNIAQSASRNAALKIADQANEAAKAEQVENEDKDNQVDFAGLQANKSDKAEDQGSSEPAHIKQLRDMIKKMQEQLAEQQKQLAQLAASKMDESAKLAAISTKNAVIATLNGQIQAATAQLLQALSKTGGSSAGGVISTQA